MISEELMWLTSRFCLDTIVSGTTGPFPSYSAESRSATECRIRDGWSDRVTQTDSSAAGRSEQHSPAPPVGGVERGGRARISSELWRKFMTGGKQALNWRRIMPRFSSLTTVAHFEPTNKAINARILQFCGNFVRNGKLAGRMDERNFLIPS